MADAAANADGKAGGGEGKSPQRNIFDVLVVLIGVVALVALAFKAMDEFDTAQDAATILGIVLAPVASIALAAFGVTQAVQASAQASKANEKAEQARSEATNAKTEVQEKQRAAADLAEQLRPMRDLVQTFSAEGFSPPGRDDVQFLQPDQPLNLTGTAPQGTRAVVIPQERFRQALDGYERAQATIERMRE